MLSLVRSRLSRAMAAAVMIAGVAGSSGPLLADSAAPTIGSLLFDNPQIDNVKPGETMVYHLQRTVSDEKLLGQPFADDITIGVRSIDDTGKREVSVKIFTGEHAREPQVIFGLTINPVLVVFLDRCVSTMSQVAGGNPIYLKRQFRKALGTDKAKIEPLKFDYAGHSVDGYKITVQPYLEDDNSSQLQGFEKSKFTILVSDAVPGRFAEMTGAYESTQPEQPKLLERVVIEGLGGAK